MQFEEAARSRRSVRIFGKTDVPESVVNECLDLALLAPNSSNLQPWEFYWVRTAEKKAELVRACLSQPAARTAKELVVFVARTDTWRRNNREMLKHFEQQKAEGKPPHPHAKVYYEKLVPWAYHQGPLSLFGLIKRIFLWARGWFKATPREPVSHQDMRIWAIKSTALACENYMLAMRSKGFDTCPMEGFDRVRVKKLLGLGSGAEVVMVISSGKRAATGVYASQVRFDRSFFVKEI